jgi:hypothetical protein
MSAGFKGYLAKVERVTDTHIVARTVRAYDPGSKKKLHRRKLRIRVENSGYDMTAARMLVGENISTHGHGVFVGASKIGISFSENSIMLVESGCLKSAVVAERLIRKALEEASPYGSGRPTEG